MSPAQNAQVAERLQHALETVDPDALFALYADGAEIWHSTDQVVESPKDNLRRFNWLLRNLEGFKVSEFDQIVVEDGFVQQHVISGTKPEIYCPCMLRAWCKDGKITRIEEYFDSAAWEPPSE